MGSLIPSTYNTSQGRLFTTQLRLYQRDNDRINCWQARYAIQQSMASIRSFSLLSAAARRLEGKVAIITGGASGIGEKTARLFTRHGAKVIIADIQDDLGLNLSKELEEYTQTSASFIHCDVTDEKDVKSAVDLAISQHGKLDIMFNNAGIFRNTNMSIVDTDKAEFEEVVGVNLVGPFLGTKHAARAMIPARRGSIITTASNYAIMGGGPHDYTASKHGVVGLTRNVAVELGRYGIRVNCISPYATFTPLITKALNIVDDEEFGKSFYSNLKGSVCTTQDVAQAAVYLGSDESKFVSGHNLVVDGGCTITNAGFSMFN